MVDPGLAQSPALMVYSKPYTSAPLIAKSHRSCKLVQYTSDNFADLE